MNVSDKNNKIEKEKGGEVRRNKGENDDEI